MNPQQQIADDTVAALVALGHRKAEAKRLVGDALGSGVGAASVQELLQAVYRRPANAAPPSRAQAVTSRYAAAYYEYVSGIASSGSAHSSGQNELLQTARAVGPGLTLEEFEALGNRVGSLGAQRDRLTNREYQAALWAIPDAFRAERKDPVHFKPLRDAGGKPLDAAFEPQPPKEIEGLGIVQASGKLPMDALKGIVGQNDPAPAPQQAGPGMARQPVAPAAPEQRASNGRTGTQSQADSQRSPVPSKPATPEAIAGLGTTSIPAKVSPEAIQGILGQRQAPPTVTPQEMGGIVRGAGSGAVDAMYDNLWKKVQAGEVDEGGKPSALLQAAKMVRDAGGMQSADDLRAMAKDYRAIDRGPEYQQQMRQMVQQHIALSQNTHSPAINVPSAITGLLNQPAEGEQQSSTTSTLDKAQTIADVVGVVDQTGITDLVNSGVSLTRAFTEPGRAGEHLVNAGISALSAVPVIGDAAKIPKYAVKGARGLGRTAKGMKGLAGGNDATTANNKSFLRNGVDKAAQAALQLVSGGGDGGSGGGGNGSPPPGSDSSGAADPRKIGEDSKQAARDIKTLGGSIETFLNGMGARGAALVAVGQQVYEKALKPVIGWLKNVDEVSTKMLDDSRRLAQFNGALGNAHARLDIARLQRDIGSAQEMAGPIGRLASSQGRSEQAREDLVRPYQKLSTELQSLRTELVGAVYQAIDSIDIVGALIDRWYADEKSENAAKSSAEFVARQSEMRMKARKFDK